MENYLPSDVKLLLNVSKLYVFLFSYFLPYAILSYKCILKVFAAHAKAGAKRFQEYIQIERRKKFP